MIKLNLFFFFHAWFNARDFLVIVRDDTGISESPFDESYATTKLFAMGVAYASNIEFLTDLFSQAALSSRVSQHDRTEGQKSARTQYSSMLLARGSRFHSRSIRGTPAEYYLRYAQTRFFSCW